jgi:hypothetical protein
MLGRTKTKIIMALEEITLTDKIEVIQNGSLQIRHRHAIIDSETGEQKAASFHRHVKAPGEDVAGECERVQAVAAAVWTQECIDAYQASLPAETATDEASIDTPTAPDA